MEIYIGFSHRKTLIGKLIKFFTKSEASHVFIADKHKQLVSHSYMLGVNIINFEEFIKDSVIIDIFEVDVPPERLEWLWCQHGKGFNYLTFMWLSIVFTLSIVGIKINYVPKWSENSYTCSELVARVLGLSQMWSISPQILLKALKEERECQFMS